jgi:hypothetical protein
MYCSVPPFHRAKLYGVPSQAIVKVWCAMGKRRLQNTAFSKPSFLNMTVLHYSVFAKESRNNSFFITLILVVLYFHTKFLKGDQHKRI